MLNLSAWVNIIPSVDNEKEPMIESLNKFIRIHTNGDKHQRLGQRFVNMYTKKPWPELFYASEEDALPIIEQWLLDNQYTTTLPEPINRGNEKCSSLSRSLSGQEI